MFECIVCNNFDVIRIFKKLIYDFFFFNDTATTEIYTNLNTLSLHDALRIFYLVYEKEPFEIESINETDTENEKSGKFILNAIHRENGQRNFISEGLKNAHDENFILISDLDEIPNLSNINLNNFKEKLIFFNQEMFYYKFNLKLPNYNWVGTKSCKKKNFISAQWLRNIKDKNYPFYRFDLFFSKNKYTNIRFIKKGG